MSFTRTHSSSLRSRSSSYVHAGCPFWVAEMISAGAVGCCEKFFWIICWNCYFHPAVIIGKMNWILLVPILGASVLSQTHI